MHTSVCSYRYGADQEAARGLRGAAERGALGGEGSAGKDAGWLLTGYPAAQFEHSSDTPTCLFPDTNATSRALDSQTRPGALPLPTAPTEERRALSLGSFGNAQNSR